MDNTIIVAGGFDGDHYLASAERHDPRTGFWEKVLLASRIAAWDAICRSPK